MRNPAVTGFGRDGDEDFRIAEQQTLHQMDRAYLPLWSDGIWLPPSMSLGDFLTQVECDLLQWGLWIADGNKAQAARVLRIKRTTLHSQLARHKLTKTRERPQSQRC